MAEAIMQIRNQLNEYFQGLEKKQKIKMLVAAIFILLSMTGIIYYFTRPEYVVLYNNLEPEQAGEIINVLESNNIQATIGDSTRTVLVAKKDEKRAQIVVATQGLPASRFSYEDAFSGNSIMMTSEERSERMRLAQQSYLASTIEEIPGVKKATVNLTIPTKTGFSFSDMQKTSKASVYLDYELGHKLDKNSINGIAVLVANAVEGLDPENVTVHGPDGKVLNDNTTNQEGYLFSDRLSIQNAVKNDLERSLTEFLSTVYGRENVVVAATVKLDFNSEVTEITEYSPPIEGESTGMIRSMEKLQKSVVDDGTGGVPGTDSNTDDVTQYVEPESSTSKYQEASEVVNYEINELRKRIVKSQGEVEDITVAVFLNSKALKGGDLSQEEKRELTNMISTAAGVDTKEVIVAVREFNESTSIAQVGLEASLIDEMPLPIWLIGIIAAAILGLAYFGISAIRRRKASQAHDVEEVIKPETEAEIDLELSGSEVKQQIEKLVKKKPEAVAQLLKNWLSED